MKLYAVIPCGVDEKAPHAIFRDRAMAEQACGVIWKQSDGYHAFEVWEYETGVIYDDTASRGLWGSKRGTDAPCPTIDFKASADRKRL